MNCLLQEKYEPRPRHVHFIRMLIFFIHQKDLDNLHTMLIHFISFCNENKRKCIADGK